MTTQRILKEMYINPKRQFYKLIKTGSAYTRH